MLTARLLTNVRPWASTVMMVRSDGLSRWSVAEGKLTSMVRINIGAVIMKIMRSTRTTSTNGVTLISEIVWVVLIRFRAMSIAVTEPPSGDP